MTSLISALRPGRQTGLVLLAVVTFACIGLIFFLEPIPQDLQYHQFADVSSLWGIANFLNVVSNLPFVLIGVLGLMYTGASGSMRLRGSFVQPLERILYAVFFLGVLLTGVGSAYYHLAPDNATLFWDRLPMTIMFMSFLIIIITERIGLRFGTWVCLPLLAAGAASIIYWHFSELAGHGDLRFYGLVQFYPVLAIPLMMFLFPPRYTRGGDLVVVLAWFVVAKACEFLDAEIYALGGIISGHTLKHLTAAMALWWVLRMLRKRTPIAHAPASG